MSTAELTEVLKDLKQIEIQTRQLIQDVMSGAYASAFRGAGVEFDEVREYVEGDDPRTVDWNVTARAGRPFVKKYVDERELTIMMLVDVSRSMDAGTGAWSLRHAAARLAACIATSAARQKDKVGLMTFDEDVREVRRPNKGMGHALGLVQVILKSDSSTYATDLKTALQSARRTSRRRSILFIISDFLSTDWRSALNDAARSHDVIAIRLVPPELRRVPEACTHVESLEGPDRWVTDWSSDVHRQTSRKAIEKFDAKTAATLASSAIDVVTLSVPVQKDMNALAMPLIKLMRHRAMRRIP